MLEQQRLVIERAWDYGIEDKSEVFAAVRDVLSLLDCGKIRVCEKIADQWVVNELYKKAVILIFRVFDICVMDGVSGGNYFDRVPIKFMNWSEEDFKKSGIRVVPGAVVRLSAYIGSGSIVMPSFINVGAFVGSKTMIDSGATIGSCCQIGDNCHISSNVVIGGVLEPIQARPVIIEDNCFIGAQVGLVEGVLISEGSVISSGVQITSSSKVYDVQTGESFAGFIPPYSVVVPGSIDKGNGISYNCAIIVKRVDAQTRSKTSINELLREHYC